MANTDGTGMGTMTNRDGTAKVPLATNMGTWMENYANPYVAPPQEVVQHQQPASEWSQDVANDVGTWATQTAWGTAFGFAYGWGVGWRGSRHLSNKYDATSVYHGTFASFRVPLDVVHSSLSCAKWGFRVGAFTCALSGISIFLERQRLATARDPSALPPAIAGFLDPAGLPMQVAPTAVAGAAVGGGFAYMRQGGVRGLATWMLFGGGLAGGAKALEISLDRTIVYLEEQQRQAERQAAAPTTPTAS